MGNGQGLTGAQLELTETCGSRERCWWQRRQIGAVLVLSQVDGRHLATQHTHQLFHPLVVALYVHQDLELGLPSVGASRLDMKHIHSQVLRITVP